MQLSKRLYTIAKCVPRGSRVADVGTDHAYIPIYLIKHGIAACCIATDINKGPLQKARQNMAQHQVEGIDLRLAGGLSAIRPGEVDVAIMAGMGGYLIIDILKQDAVLVQSIRRLILQPQQDIPKVRKYLHTIGFKIADEAFVEEEDKYYTVITAIPGYEVYDKEYEYTYGRLLIEKKPEDFKVYMQKKQQKLAKLYEELSKINSMYGAKRKKELEQECKIHGEVMQCIF